MGLLRKIREFFQKKQQERNEACEALLGRVEKALDEEQRLFSDPEREIAGSQLKEWEQEQKELLYQLENLPQNLKKASGYDALISQGAYLRSAARTIEERVRIHNENAWNRRIEKAYELIGEVEGRKLDEQQILCVVKEVHNHLVIAGAGTGKTTTIVGKIKYLLKSGTYKPEEILVLSFTNASASEMKERIAKETGCDIAASTFHKLGLNILTQVDGKVPRITKISLKKLIREQMQACLKEEWYLQLLNSYLLYHRVKSRSEFEFETETEYNEYLSLNPPVTLRNERVKSYGEMDIANFFAENGIQYQYEQPYKIDTRTTEYGQYYPDFYLPDYDIYVEYFGTDRKGKVPSYFKGRNGMSASESYQASMEWKRQLHQENETTLLECFAYEKLEGTLLENLKKKLEAASVSVTPEASEKIWAEISEKNTALLEGIIELFEMMVNLIKSNGYDVDQVRERNIGSRYERENRLLLELLEPILDAYRRYLSEQEEIDFNDMINQAAQYIRDGRYENPYSYVIVDEYQDISKARFLLLDSLRKSKDYDLFCVGDDWQSIYRFAGSDIGFILDFEKYWGETEISRIETTYRFTQKLIEISGSFIMKNPLQIRKSIKGKAEEEGFPLEEIRGYTDDYAVQFMVEKVRSLPSDSSVFFIGRYTFDAKLLSDKAGWECQYQNASGLVEVKDTTRQDLNMAFLTAHKSKGLQADYVFIINNKKGKLGFPSQIQDAPVLELLLDNSDSYPYAEERRLFYVALTRAKKKVFLVTVKDKESEFAMELRKGYEKEKKCVGFQCPLCGGRLFKRKGPYGTFWGCENYRSKGCTYKRKAPG